MARLAQVSLIKHPRLKTFNKTILKHHVSKLSQPMSLSFRPRLFHKAGQLIQIFDCGECVVQGSYSR